jgi:hypothetical protein
MHHHRKRTAFGSVNKYIRVSGSDITVPTGETAQSAWNKSIARANQEYECRVHNLIGENCHQYVLSFVLQLLRTVNEIC